MSSRKQRSNKRKKIGSEASNANAPETLQTPNVCESLVKARTPIGTPLKGKSKSFDRISHVKGSQRIPGDQDRVDVDNPRRKIRWENYNVLRELIVHEFGFFGANGHVAADGFILQAADVIRSRGIYQPSYNFDTLKNVTR